MRLLILVLCSLAETTAFCGCLNFGSARAGSACRDSASEIVWRNAPASPERGEDSGASYDRLIDDPAITTGVYTAGDAAFEFRAPGENLLEIFITSQDPDNDSFSLEVNGAIADSRYVIKPGPDRMMPKRRILRVTLLGVVREGQTFAIRTGVNRYLLTAIRWTPRQTLEAEWAPALRERARGILADPFFDELRYARAGHLRHIYDRLIFSNRDAVRKEALLGLTRAYYWAAAENHRVGDIARTDELFRQAIRQIPDDPTLGQMISASCLGTNSSGAAMPQGPYCAQYPPISWGTGQPAPPAGAPQWALAQYNLYSRMEAITRWWVGKRQAPNGELGGGWDDDVEILRHWTTMAHGFGSPVAAAGLRKMADGIWTSDRILNAYDRIVNDVEHSSEVTTDTQPALLALDPDNAEVLSRLAATTACADNWIAMQPDGRWRFRGSWFNCKEFDPKPERAVDVHMNTRALGPALWYAYLARDGKIISLLSNWAESFVEAMKSAADGKPAGIFPSAVQSANGSYVIGSDRWDKPAVEWDYYQWSGEAQEAYASFLLGLHDLTGEARWLQAATESFQVLANCMRNASLCEEIKRNPEAFYEWRRRSNDSRYDTHFGYNPAESERDSLNLMTRLARDMESRLNANLGMWTTEVLYTDRVYYQMPVEYQRFLFGGEGPRGDRYPTFAVTWPISEPFFARAVLKAAPTAIKLRLYGLDSKPAQVPLRIWRLRSGRYSWVSKDEAGKTLASGNLVLSKLPQTIQLPLPPRTEVNITIEAAGVASTR